MNIRSLKKHIYEIIYEADTVGGKAFDIALFYAIILSVVIVMLDSVHALNIQFGHWFHMLEWVITILFSIEYVLRVWTVKRASKYIFSFYGIIDLMSVLPAYLGLFIAGTHFLVVIRILRLLRIFRVLKLVRYIGATEDLVSAFGASKRKIVVFMEFVLIIVVIMGALIYLIEGPENGFTSIPKSVYWAIVTITTVGYGDIAPQTVAGQALASVLMITGFAIIAVPTGIITAEINRVGKSKNTQACSNCLYGHHDNDALYCKKCGQKL